MNTRLVYVRLLEEGTEVFRPATAVEQESGLFRLLAPPDYDDTDEHWEFLPGAVVRLAPRESSGKTFDVAVSPGTTNRGER